MKKKRGRPKAYSNELFLQFITKTPTTPEKVKRDIEQKYDRVLSWGTVWKYLERLAVDGVIQKRKISKYHVYFT